MLCAYASVCVCVCVSTTVSRPHHMHTHPHRVLSLVNKKISDRGGTATDGDSGLTNRIKLPYQLILGEAINF